MGCWQTVSGERYSEIMLGYEHYANLTGGLVGSYAIIIRTAIGNYSDAINSKCVS